MLKLTVLINNIILNFVNVKSKHVQGQYQKVSINGRISIPHIVKKEYHNNN